MCVHSGRQQFTPPWSNDRIGRPPELARLVTEVPAIVAADSSPDDQLRLGDVAVPVDEVHAAFAKFFSDLHPHFPFLSPTLTPEDCRDDSPALLWTIITVCMKVMNRGLFERLQPLLRTLISQMVNTQNQGIPECQALCLLCLWPLDGVLGRGGDNIHLYARLAYAIATERGLHRPDFPHEYR